METIFSHALITVYFLTALVLIPSLSTSAQDLTDQQKKEIVYRMYEDYRKEFPEVKEMTPKAAMKKRGQQNILFVDTRKPAEMAVSMLPGAIPLKEFEENRSLYRDRTIVAYCTISYRSGKFAAEMAMKGMDILNLRGGLLAWVLEGGEVYNADGETKRIHVYGKEWDYPPEGYESLRFGFFERHF